MPTEYICSSDAVVTVDLESTITAHKIVKKLSIGQRVQVIEVRTTSNGQQRAQTPDGWVSVVSTNGKRLLEPVASNAPAVDEPSSDTGYSHAEQMRHLEEELEEKRHTRTLLESEGQDVSSIAADVAALEKVVAGVRAGIPQISPAVVQGKVVEVNNLEVTVAESGDLGLHFGEQAGTLPPVLTGIDKNVPFASALTQLHPGLYLDLLNGEPTLGLTFKSVIKITTRRPLRLTFIERADWQRRNRASGDARSVTPDRTAAEDEAWVAPKVKNRSTRTRTIKREVQEAIQYSAGQQPIWRHAGFVSLFIQPYMADCNAGAQKINGLDQFLGSVDLVTTMLTLVPPIPGTDAVQKVHQALQETRLLAEKLTNASSNENPTEFRHFLSYLVDRLRLAPKGAVIIVPGGWSWRDEGVLRVHQVEGRLEYILAVKSSSSKSLSSVREGTLIRPTLSRVRCYTA
jgi:hypothetical protein